MTRFSRGGGQEGAVSQACVFGLVVIDLGFQIDATYQRLGCGAGRSAKDFERATLVPNEVCRSGVEKFSQAMRISWAQSWARNFERRHAEGIFCKHSVG
jgi:hypothetical protein